MSASQQTCLPQKSLCPLWKDGFEVWHIWVFLSALVFGNLWLITSGTIERPTPGKLPLDAIVTPSNEVFRLMLLTTCVLFAKTHAMAWAQVLTACKNNSFSKNPWDYATGSAKVAPRKTEQDLVKTTLHNIHGNDVENVPLTLTLHALLVLVQPTLATARLIFVTYAASRVAHTFWYAWYGSHEIRAIFWSLNCWANYAAVCQLLAACDVL